MAKCRIELDPANAGQFFACCGLFEISELLSPGGRAEFAEGGREFLLSTNAAAPLPTLKLLERSEESISEPTLEPLVLCVDGRQIELNWWLNHTHSGKSSLKTWGGQQTPRRVFEELLRLLDFQCPFANLFEFSAFTKSRFGVDSRSAWEALDAGYSPNDASEAAVTFPWVEVLAVIGLQGFRPASEGRSRYRYSVWLTPLTLTPARAAASAPWSGLPSQTFSFEIATRGQGYKTFLIAKGVENARRVNAF